MFFKKALLAASLLAVSASASALTVNDGSEVNLNEIINGTLIQDGSTINVLGDTDTTIASTDALFTSTDAGGSSATFLIEITGGQSTQSFGIYNGNDYVELFVGSDVGTYVAGSYAAYGVGNYSGAVAQTNTYSKVTFGVNGSQTTVRVDGIEVGNFSSSDFGFYMANGSTLIHSESDKNAGGTDRFISIAGQDQKINLGSEVTYGCDASNLHLCETWESDDRIVAFEDGGDFDFNDLVVYVEDVTPVSEPGTLALFGLGLAGLGMARRKQNKKA